MGGAVRQHVRSTLMVVVMAAASISVVARQERGPEGMQMNFMQLSPIATALDVNHDSKISADELADAPARLKTLDKNGDGKLTRDEAGVTLPGRGGRGGERGGERGRGEEREVPPIPGPTADELLATLMRYDKNGDGKLDKSEVPDRLQGMFDRGDADKNGVLDAAELKKIAADQAAAPPAGGGERRGGGPGGRGPGRGGPGSFDVLFTTLDANHDGEISAEEIGQAATSLKALDKNNDGVITEDEVRPAQGGRGFDETRTNR